MPTVKEIIVKYLKENGYDGLYNTYFDCDCDPESLIPCYDEGYEGKFLDGKLLQCKPGDKRYCHIECHSRKWHISRRRRSDET